MAYHLALHLAAQHPPADAKSWAASCVALPAVCKPFFTGPNCDTRRGIISVTSTGAAPGCISKNLNENPFGVYGITTAPADCVVVTLPPVSLTSGSVFSISTTVNGPDPDYPFIGGIVGDNSNSPNLGAGSYNYIYLVRVICRFSGILACMQHAVPDDYAANEDPHAVHGDCPCQCMRQHAHTLPTALHNQLAICHAASPRDITST